MRTFCVRIVAVLPLDTFPTSSSDGFPLLFVPWIQALILTKLYFGKHEGAVVKCVEVLLCARVTESEVKCPTPTVPKFPTPTLKHKVNEVRLSTIL